MASSDKPELDDFGLPTRKLVPPPVDSDEVQAPPTTQDSPDKPSQPQSSETPAESEKTEAKSENETSPQVASRRSEDSEDPDDAFQDAPSTPQRTTGDPKSPEAPKPKPSEPSSGVPDASPTTVEDHEPKNTVDDKPAESSKADETQVAAAETSDAKDPGSVSEKPPTTEETQPSSTPTSIKKPGDHEQKQAEAATATVPNKRHTRGQSTSSVKKGHTRGASTTNTGPVQLGGFSHHQATSDQKKKEEVEEAKEVNENEDWQEMPAYAPYDIYDDDNKLIAQEHTVEEEEAEKYGYGNLGGAGKGYTRVIMDDDAESATSLDENTKYLFKEANGTSMTADDEEQRDAVSQMEATKDLLTEGQRVAYVGLTRLEIFQIVKDADALERTRSTKKEVALASEHTKMWGQKMMIRLYAHMDISAAEQIMVEQLSDHGVLPSDLTPLLMANARVKNPMAKETARDSISSSAYDRGNSVDLATIPESPTSESSLSRDREEQNRTKDGNRITELDDDEDDGEAEKKEESISNGKKEKEAERSAQDNLPMDSPTPDEEKSADPPPPYEMHPSEEMPEVKTPSQLPSDKNLEIDLRWTVLCDLFLLLIADSTYDARSRLLLERVGNSLEIDWLDIRKFEKRVTDALEMQQQAEKENWNEEEHMETRRKRALKKRYVMMGLATVGGGLVIGLSAGLLAPVIGAGLAAGFTTIGVTGTGTFLGGVGGAAIITSAAASSGSVIGVRAANRRTGAVKTFEYRPLHNNKRVHLIVTISGWMTGKVDDVRLPFSTVDPIMGDLYSVLWEPEMLRSTGDTINILATEALTQGLQQVLGSTILMGLMAALQLPVILTKLAYLIDNPWAVSLDRATAAGLILADSLIDRNLGTRPVTLVGYSIGARVIFSCLQELSRRGAYGLVQNVYMFGSPIVTKKDEFLRARSVVPGRFVNGYHTNDWILGYLFRLTNGGIRRVAGLAPIDEVPRIENLNVTDLVKGHMEYRRMMPRLLRECGWPVESDDFTEIEDPDPDDHNKRQRELIDEIEEARRELEREGQKSKKSRFSIFGRKKQIEKADWEIYDSSDKSKEAGKTEDGEGNNHGILFDIDAIRAELAKDEMQVKELQSTLPPMKLDLSSPSPSSSSANLRTQSTDALSYRPSFDSRLSEGPPSVSGSHKKGTSSPYWAAPQEPYREEDISMTFDTSFDESSTRTPPPPPPKDYSAPQPSRPEMKSAQTMPNMALNDPWADLDDDDFGKEKEVTMTFA